MEKPEDSWNELKYNKGFGNHFESEAEPEVLHPFQNTPKKVNYNLYAE